MSESAKTTELLETLARVLLRCTGIGFLLLLFAFGFYMLAADFAYELHGDMFGLSTHEVDVVFYCWMGLLKLFVIVFFLIPWLAIKLVLRNGETES